MERRARFHHEVLVVDRSGRPSETSVNTSSQSLWSRRSNVVRSKGYRHKAARAMMMMMMMMLLMLLMLLLLLLMREDLACVAKSFPLKAGPSPGMLGREHERSHHRGATSACSHVVGIRAQPAEGDGLLGTTRLGRGFRCSWRGCIVLLLLFCAVRRTAR